MTDTEQIQGGADCVEAKAYLGRMDIYELRVPCCVTRIGNWAFAGMRRLERLWLPARDIEFGKCVFDKCESLKEVFLYDEHDPTGAVNSSSARVLADYLTRVRGSTAAWSFCGGMWNKYLCGDGDADNASEYDRELLRYIEAPEEDGFEPMWFGGEEDYDDTTTNVEKYRHAKRMERTGVIYNRISQKVGLCVQSREELLAALRRMMPDTFTYLCEREPENTEYFCSFIEAGCVGEDTLPYIHTFCHMLSTENNARLLAYERKLTNTSAVFDRFSL